MTIVAFWKPRERYGFLSQWFQATYLYGGQYTKMLNKESCMLKPLLLATLKSLLKSSIAPIRVKLSNSVGPLRGTMMSFGKQLEELSH